ncbi:hypothetical protein HanLR1_Chr14g0533891 [Helianthus annuus]|nr:hypothetical protein HanHA89_Chr14g0571491 [Helianthus annuus]KAJ0656275.1 hypothetical protein HanLR1_Chr14g0533891 [Helianthus annuus]
MVCSFVLFRVLSWVLQFQLQFSGSDGFGVRSISGTGQSLVRVTSHVSAQQVRKFWVSAECGSGFLFGSRIGFGSAAVNHGSVVREMVQFWFSQNWSKLGQSGQHQVNCSVSGFGLSWFGSTVVWVKIRVRSTVLGPSQPGQTWSTRLTRSTRSTQLAYPTNRREGFGKDFNGPTISYFYSFNSLHENELEPK